MKIILYTTEKLKKSIDKVLYFKKLDYETYRYDLQIKRKLLPKCLAGIRYLEFINE